jgi:hypothetical protein
MSPADPIGLRQSPLNEKMRERELTLSGRCFELSPIVRRCSRIAPSSRRINKINDFHLMQLCLVGTPKYA